MNKVAGVSKRWGGCETYVVGNASAALVFPRVGVNDLVAKRTVGQVGPLRDVEDLLHARLGQHAAAGRPQLAQNAEERRLAAAVGPRDHQVHARLNLEIHLRDELVAVRAVDGHVLENNVIRVHNLGTSGTAVFDLRLGLFLRLVLGLRVAGGVRSDHYALVPAVLQVIQHLVHLVDERGVARKVLDFLVRDHQATDRFRQINQQRRVPHIVLRDLSLIISELGEVFLGVGAEDGEADDGVAGHDGAVLDEHGVVDAHEEALLEDEADVAVELVEARVDVLALPVLPVVEGDFLGVGQHLRVQRAVLALEALLLRGQPAEGRGDQPDHQPGEAVPGEGDGGALPADQLAQLAAEQDHVEHGLDHVDVQVGQAGGPLLGVLRQPLVGVRNAVVQVANLVVVHVAQVHAVEVVGQPLAELQGQLLLDVVDARVDRRRGHSEQEEIKNLQTARTAD